MKKFRIAALALVLLMAMVCLTGCGSKIVGKWNLTGGAMYDEMMGLGTVEFEFKKNGDMSMTVGALGFTETETGTYETKGDKLTMTTEDGTSDECTFKVKGDELTIIGADDMDMVLTKVD